MSHIWEFLDKDRAVFTNQMRKNFITCKSSGSVLPLMHRQLAALPLVQNAKSGPQRNVHILTS